MPWQPALAAFLVTLVFLQLLVSQLGRRLVLDRPNERSLHEQPVPRTGGLAIIAGVAAGCLVGQPGFGVTLGLAGALAAVSFLDDVFGLRTLLRLALHLAAASVMLIIELRFPGWLPLVVFALAIAWYANLYNFMDGSDGLAGGMALIGFGAYGAAAALSGVHPLAELSFALAAASGAFLTRNFHPASIFMGDVGSVPLGFLAGALGLIGWNDGLWPLWFPVLVFAPFVCDATLTLVRRLLRGERVWQAHREHYYQRLVRMGFGHSRTAAIEYAVMLACAAIALLAREATVPLQIVALAVATSGLIAIAVWVDLRWARFQSRTGEAQA
ncbi:MAG TPA: glycosyltransferase family 4 protein [Burkholderiales bacterium]|nr:glycosyltransferase family 4 protein [Burkholderiales bacterium]